MFGTRKSPPDAVEKRIAATARKTAATAPMRLRHTERAAPRRTCFRFAHIDGDSGAYHCIVKDISVNGVKIVLEGAFSIGGQTTLICGQTGARQACRVAWQEGNEAGLDFVS